MLFCSVPAVAVVVVGIIINNDGKGHKRSRYNCWDDAGCTKVNQCCKIGMKTNLKLAFEEDLHMVSN
jgi:hypothetical protein